VVAGNVMAYEKLGSAPLECAHRDGISLYACMVENSEDVHHA